MAVDRCTVWARPTKFANQVLCERPIDCGSCPERGVSIVAGGGEPQATAAETAWELESEPRRRGELTCDAIGKLYHAIIDRGDKGLKLGTKY